MKLVVPIQNTTARLITWLYPMTAKPPKKGRQHFGIGLISK